MPLLATQKYELIRRRVEPWPWGKWAASAHLPYKEKSLEQSRLWSSPAPLPPWQVAYFSTATGRHALDPTHTHTHFLWHNLTCSRPHGETQTNSSLHTVCTDLNLSLLNWGNASRLQFDWWKLLRLIPIFPDTVNVLFQHLSYPNLNISRIYINKYNK